jgi:4-diphosphocytidyl-2-C-methyl-D-erythritol kinase
MAIAVQAPAKLNLALSVGPPDERGMHPICTWMVTVSLCDDLLVTRLDGGRLSRYAILWHPDALRPREIDWPVPQDLAVRAHLALEQHVGRTLPVQLKLDKRIPVGGGLGGGSSDAAAMLRAVNELFDLGLTDDELREIAAGLGSDVAFFVRGASALVHGFGERVEPLTETGELHAALVFPDAFCPTARVYAAFDEPHATAAWRGDEVRALAQRGGTPPAESVFNDLAPAAIHVEPGLGESLKRLGEFAQRPAHVAGSGSSLFVLCDDAGHARRLAEAVENQLNLPAVAVRGPHTLSLVQS